MNYIKQIHSLDWSKINHFQIMFASLVFAKEFSKTARYISLSKPGFGTLPAFQEFIAGEINTNNLVYDDYNKRGDHWEFLAYFMSKDTFQSQLKKYHSTTKKGIQNSFGINEYGLYIHFDNLLNIKAIDQYENYVESLHGEYRLATLVSRERHLHGIFKNILEAHDWENLGFGFFQYFLQRHIELDSSDGGHDDLMSSIIDIDMHKYEFYLVTFWHYRWKIYCSLM